MPEPWVNVTPYLNKNKKVNGMVSNAVFGASSTAADVVRGRDLSGVVAIVTGGAAGIGIETVRALASVGADVMIAVRNRAAGEFAAATINSELGRVAVSTGLLDLADLVSVRAFASAWGDRPLNLLVNNAGIMAGPLARTADGFEMNIGINHLGHFLLFQLLRPNLELGAPARVIQLSSGAHLRWPFDFDDWNFLSQPYDPTAAYGRSKTATALAAVAISDRYESRGINSWSVMPGVIRTGLFKDMDEKAEADLMARVGSMQKTPQQGAATTVWAALAPELEGRGGLYLENCAIAGAPALSPPSGVGPHAQDLGAAQRLWAISSEAVHG